MRQSSRTEPSKGVGPAQSKGVFTGLKTRFYNGRTEREAMVQANGMKPGEESADITSYGLDGRSEEEVRCTNCSGIYCGRRNIRIVDGRPLCICNLKLIGKR